MAKVDSRLFKLIKPVLDTTGVDYAIGGAVAMSIAGYTRQTEDLDVFFKHTDRPLVLRALRAAGITFATVADPYQYAIIPSLKNPDRRVDLLFTSEDLEVDAVGFPDEEIVSVGKYKVAVKVFPALLIKTAKVRSDREKDHDDVRRMYERGLIDPDEIVDTLQRYLEPSPRRRLNDILAGRVPR
jgi:hypothetical protein